MKALAALILFAWSVSSAQLVTENWRHSIPAAGDGHAAQWILKDGKGRLLTAGILGGVGGGSDIGVALLDGAGKVIAEKRFDRGGMEYVLGVIALDGGGYYLYGRSTGYIGGSCLTGWKVFTGFGQATEDDACSSADLYPYHAFAMRLDDNLDTLWIRDLGKLRGYTAEGFAGAGGNLTLFHVPEDKDSLCMQSVEADGRVGARICFRASRYEDFSVVAEAGGTFLASGYLYDSAAAAYTPWFQRVGNAGQVLWSHALQPFSWATQHFAHFSGGMALSYWKRAPKPYVEGREEEVEVRVQGTTVATTILKRFSDIHAATGKLRTVSGALAFPAQPGAKAVRSHLYAFSEDVLDPDIRADIRASSVAYGSSDELWFAGSAESADPLSGFTFGRLRIDYPPVFPAALDPVQSYSEGDTVRIPIRPQDDFNPEAMKVTFQSFGGGPFLNPTTGIFEWLPKPDWFGDTTFMIRAEDFLGQKDSVLLRLSFANVNDTPRIQTELAPWHFVVRDSGLNAKIRIHDPDGDAVAVKILAGPPGLTVSAGGEIRWLPGPGDAGFHPLVIQASDSRASKSAAFSLWVGDTLPAFSDPVQLSAPGVQVLAAYPEHGSRILVRATGATVPPHPIVVTLQSDFAYPPTYALHLGRLGPPPGAFMQLEVDLADGFLNGRTEVLQDGKPLPFQIKDSARITFTLTEDRFVFIRTNFQGASNAALSPERGLDPGRRAIGKAEGVNALGRRFKGEGRGKQVVFPQSSTGKKPKAR